MALWPFAGVLEWDDHQENAKSHSSSVTYSLISLDLGMNSGRRMEPHMFTLHREQEWKTQCRMAHSLSWHPEQWLSQGPLAGSAVCDTQHCFPQDSSCIVPSCSLSNLGGKTENIFLRAILQPGQIQLTPFFLIFPSS